MIVIYYFKGFQTKKTTDLELKFHADTTAINTMVSSA